MKITNTHVYFYGGTFSNWHPAKFECASGRKFVNTEQAFMWYKAMEFGDKETAEKILLETNPRNVKALGREVKNFKRETWDKVSFGHMIYVNILKYTQNKAMGDELIDTGTRILVEASPYDKIWGVGLDKYDPLILDEKNWPGQNLLGKALMEVRRYLIEERTLDKLFNPSPV